MRDRRRDLVGVLNGSRLIEQPHIAPEVARARAFVAAGERVLVEVGFDHGRRLHSTATLAPAWSVLGLETRKRRVEEARARAERDGLQNVLPWRLDARTAFAQVFGDRSIDFVEVLFPTPWWDPKLRQRRLLIREPFVRDVVRTLKPGGILHIATDVVDYAAHIEEVMDRVPELTRLPADVAGLLRPPCEQRSRREWKCARESIPIYRYYYQHGSRDQNLIPTCPPSSNQP